MESIDVVTDEERGRAFLDDIIEFTNTNITALGFLPRPVYEDALNLGRLWILVDGTDRYRGHLLFGGAYPTIKIKQLFVTPEMRHQGLARRLVDKLVDFAEEEGYGSIRARVATDLEANAAWEHLGFSTAETVQGGKTTGRALNVRFRRLSPRGRQTHLFGIIDAKPAIDALVARGMPINRSHWYALDLNIWLDFSRQREPFFGPAKALIQEASRGRFRLRFTAEAKAEAERTAGERGNDPLLEIAQTWQVLPEADAAAIDKMVDQMRAIVFPERSTTRRHAASDLSDLRHLAMSALANASGFVTRERAILRQQRVIRERFGLEVLMPNDLVDDADPTVASLASLSQDLRVEPIAKRRDAIAQLINAALTARNARFRSLDVEDHGRICIIDQEIVGIVYWSSAPRADVEAYLMVGSSDTSDDEVRQRVFDILLGVLAAEAKSTHGLHRLILRVDPETGSDFRNDLIRSGFFSTNELDAFVRFVSGDPLLFDDWSRVRTVVERELGAKSEWLQNSSDGPVLRLHSNGGTIEFNRFEFETRFGLSALTLERRRTVCIPIQERYSNELLPRPTRPMLFQEHDAAYRIERVYFRSPTAARILQPGDILLFYVSQPISSLIGVARCTVSEVLSTKEAAERFRRLAVLDPHDVGDPVHCIAFDNYLSFKHLIDRKGLSRHGALPRQDFVTLSELAPSVDLLQLLRDGLQAPK